METNNKYKILNFWNDNNDLYVNYTVIDTNNKLANVIDIFNTNDISDDYYALDNEEIEKKLLDLVKNKKSNVFEFPKVSELSNLLNDIYFSVIENESNMCHIDVNDWEQLCEEKNYTDKDIEFLKEEIKKYNLENYITIDSDGYKICGYGGLQCCFNDDTRNIDSELER